MRCKFIRSLLDLTPGYHYPRQQVVCASPVLAPHGAVPIDYHTRVTMTLNHGNDDAQRAVVAAFLWGSLQAPAVAAEVLYNQANTPPFARAGNSPCRYLQRLKR
jgi:hypothetical protein